MQIGRVLLYENYKRFDVYLNQLLQETYSAKSSSNNIYFGNIVTLASCYNFLSSTIGYFNSH